MITLVWLDLLKERISYYQKEGKLTDEMKEFVKPLMDYGNYCERNIIDGLDKQMTEIKAQFTKEMEEFAKYEKEVNALLGVGIEV